MALDGKLLADARDELERIRSANAAERSARIRSLYRRIPELESIDARLRSQMAELVGLALKKDAPPADAVKRLEEESLALQRRKRELLIQNGYPEDYLDEIYSCTDCRDTGYIGGRMCDCLKRLYNRKITSELGVLLKNGDESFERFDLSLYGEYAESMEIVFFTCREYAASFGKNSMNLLFQGGTGLGKTYLSACIARTVAEKGFSVCYDTASSALDAFELRKFARDAETAAAASEKTQRMLDCDLMILDDLGTEMATPMAISALYTLINTRLVNGKKTVISTNCGDAELRRRYGDQICSRIEGEFTKLPFAGRDIRTMKRRDAK